MSVTGRTRLLRQPELSPLALLGLLQSSMGYSWMTEEFDDVVEDLTDAFGPMHPLVHEKLRALRSCGMTAAPWHRFEVFSPIIRAFNGIPVDFARHFTFDAHQMALGISVLEKLRKEPFSDEIAKYCAAALMTKGLHIIPTPELEFARKFLRPFNESAQQIFERIKTVPLGQIEMDVATNDQVQAIQGRAELAVYIDTLRLWKEHIVHAKGAVL